VYACGTPCTHYKDPVIHVSVRWVEDTQHTPILGSAKLLLLCPAEGSRNFTRKVVTKYVTKYKQTKTKKNKNLHEKFVLVILVVDVSVQGRVRPGIGCLEPNPFAHVAPHPVDPRLQGCSLVIHVHAWIQPRHCPPQPRQPVWQGSTRKVKITLSVLVARSMSHTMSRSHTRSSHTHKVQVAWSMSHS